MTPVCEHSPPKQPRNAITDLERDRLRNLGQLGSLASPLALPHLQQQQLKTITTPSFGSESLAIRCHREKSSRHVVYQVPDTELN